MGFNKILEIQKEVEKPQKGTGTMGHRWILLFLAIIIVACNHKPEYTLTYYTDTEFNSVFVWSH